MSVVVVGGAGISGLAAAYFLATRSTSASASAAAARQKMMTIHLVESRRRTGGWLSSIRQNGILFEGGPRSLRVAANGVETLSLACQLGLHDRIVWAPRSSPAARNRYILVKGRLELLPNSLGSFLRASATLKDCFFQMAWEPFRRKKTATGGEDESVYEFAKRRLGQPAAERLFGSLCHGVYAGDVRQLSIRSCFPSLYQYEQDHGSILRGLLLSRRKKNNEAATTTGEAEIARRAIPSEVLRASEKSAMWSFRDGIETLAQALETELRKDPSVQFHMGHAIKEMRLSEDDGRVEVRMEDVNGSGKSEVLRSDAVLSTLPAASLARAMPQFPPLREQLSQVPYVDVIVVNLAFAKENLIPFQGFGYLVPPCEDEDVLGTIFDSCAFHEQDELVGKNLTRLTVMMGGHDFERRFGSPESLDPENILQRALNAIQRHLGISEIPIAHRVSINRQCIPQYTLNHHQRLRSIGALIEGSSWKGKLAMAGPIFGGVGVHDCILSSKRAAEQFTVRNYGTTTTRTNGVGMDVTSVTEKRKLYPCDAVPLAKKFLRATTSLFEMFAKPWSQDHILVPQRWKVGKPQPAPLVLTSYRVKFAFHPLTPSTPQRNRAKRRVVAALLDHMPALAPCRYDYLFKLNVPQVLVAPPSLIQDSVKSALTTMTNRTAAPAQQQQRTSSSVGGFQVGPQQTRKRSPSRESPSPRVNLSLSRPVTAPMDQQRKK